MIRFFQTSTPSIIATEVDHMLTSQETAALQWLYGNATPLEGDTVEGSFVGPRRG